MRILEIHGCKVHIWGELAKIYADSGQKADKVWNYILEEGLLESNVVFNEN